MVVTVYARHSGKCPQSKVRHTGQFKRCTCPLWLRWGKSRKHSARTRSWEIATKGTRKLEEELEREALGSRCPRLQTTSRSMRALELYLADRSQRGLKDSSKAQRLLGRLREYAYPDAWIELQLAHMPRNKVSAAYNYAQYLDGRKRMIQDWSDYLDEQLKKAKKIA